MLHLAIQTTEKPDNFALMNDEKVIFHKFIDGTNFSSDSLFSEVKKALIYNKIKANEIEFVTCVIGPGSFTGIKSGLAFAKGFAYGKKLPMIAVNSLEVLAYGARNEIEGRIMAMLDARNQRVYAQLFEIQEGKFQEKSEIVVDELEALLKEHKAIQLVGSGATANSELIAKLGNFQIIENTTIDATVTGILGLERFKKKHVFDSYNIEPIFISEPKITLN